MTRIDIVYDGHPYSTGTVKAVELLISSHSRISVAEIIPDR